MADGGWALSVGQDSVAALEFLLSSFHPYLSGLQSWCSQEEL